MINTTSLTHLLEDNDICSNLGNINRGIEREALRVNPQGFIANTPHPQALGSPLTHRYITTDFSEALLEFITPVANSVDKTMRELHSIHQFAGTQLGEEALWPCSMPCQLGSDANIPVAHYGSSNIAKMKTVYRLGLGHRYGRRMQTVAGVHYNFSLSQAFWIALQKRLGNKEPLQTFINNQYFALIRNFRRYYWLLVYLFGASPAVSNSFIGNRAHALSTFDNDTLYLANSTSLRMGDLGYQSKAQESLFVCYNHLDTYIETLGNAIKQPYPSYEAIGIKQLDGEYSQLSTALLQIENEFYSPIRPKRVTQSGETPLHALQQSGIEYIEVRCLDVDPFEPLGISEDTIRFVDCFLLLCLMNESPLCDMAEYGLISENQRRIVMHGRDPELKIFCGKQEYNMRDYARSLIDNMRGFALSLDKLNDNTPHLRSLQLQLDKIDNADKTASARMLNTMHQQKLSFHAFSVRQAAAHSNYLHGQKLSDDTKEKFVAESEASIKRRKKIEAGDTLPFDTYLKEYYENAYSKAQPKSFANAVQ